MWSAPRHLRGAEIYSGSRFYRSASGVFQVFQQAGGRECSFLFPTPTQSPRLTWPLTKSNLINGSPHLDITSNRKVKKNLKRRKRITPWHHLLDGLTYCAVIPVFRPSVGLRCRPIVDITSIISSYYMMVSFQRKEAFRSKRKIFGNLRWFVEKRPVHSPHAPLKYRILELEERYAHVVPSPTKMQPRSYVMLCKLIYTSVGGSDFGPPSTTN